MKRMTLLCLLLALAALAGCASVGPADGWTPEQAAENDCYQMAFQVLPEGGKLHEYIVTSQFDPALEEPLALTGYTVLHGGALSTFVRVGTDDPTEDLDGNNCYVDFYYDGGNGRIAAYRACWKDAPGIEAGLADRLREYPDGYQAMLRRDDLVIEDVDGKLLNGQLWENFWNDVEAGRSSEVTLARFTVEGDPILEYVRFDGTAFYLVCDSSRDSFGSDPRYTAGVYGYLQRLDSGDGLWYILTDEKFADYAAYQDWLSSDGHPEEEKRPQILLRIAAE